MWPVQITGKVEEINGTTVTLKKKKEKRENYKVKITATIRSMIELTLFNIVINNNIV